jgi:hypothetical protein
LRGPSLDGAVLDEAAFMDPYVRVIIESQIAVTKGPLLVISTPNPEGPGWFTEECAKAEFKMKSGDKDYAYWKFTINDNPLIDDGEKQRLREAHSDDVFNVEYMAEESAQGGVLFSEFNYNLHVKEMEPVGQLVRGLDWGISHPTACIWAYVKKDPPMIYIADEFVRSDLRIEESCGVIKAMTGSKKVEWTVIDPSTRKRNSQTPRNDYDEFNRNGVPCILADNSYRGYDIVKLMFKKNMIMIHPKCRNLISQLKSILYSGKFSNANGTDDVTDTLRYVCIRAHDVIFNGNIQSNEPVSKGSPFLSLKDQSFRFVKSDSMGWANAEYEEVA